MVSIAALKKERRLQVTYQEEWSLHALPESPGFPPGSPGIHWALSMFYLSLLGYFHVPHESTRFSSGSPSVYWDLIRFSWDLLGSPQVLLVFTGFFHVPHESARFSSGPPSVYWVFSMVSSVITKTCM